MAKCAILLSVLVLVWTPLGRSDEGDKTPDFCNLFPEKGHGPSCYAYIPQFFFNSTSHECEEFIYGGCGGNQNRFGSKKKCMETCNPNPRIALVREVMPMSILPGGCVDRRRPHRRDNACNQPAEPGPCMGYYPHYFYNTQSKKCEIFIYGGCKGNQNRFRSLTTCQMYCRTVPVFNATEVCNLAPETGPCRAAFPRLYYNPTSQRCEPFIYGGCDGNDNNFDSIDDCRRSCHPEGTDVITPLVRSAAGQQQVRSHDCTLPPETGPCRANIPVYFYNSTSHKCEKFIYGGCRGNSNKFVTKRECNLNCHRQTEQPTEASATGTTDLCHLPQDLGPCGAIFPRYHYNHQTKKCEKFDFGGCRGNQNNFIDEDECMKTCKDH